MSALLAPFDARYRQRLQALPKDAIPGIDPAAGRVLDDVVAAIEKGDSSVALAEARRAYPENAVWDYLAAAVAAGSGDIDAAVRAIHAGSTASTCSLPLCRAPGIVPCSAVPLIQSLVQEGDRLIAHDVDAIEPMITLGIRVARAAPCSYLHLIVGTSITYRFLQADMSAALASGDRQRLRRAEARSAEHRDWLAAAQSAGAMELRLVPLAKARLARLARVSVAQLDACADFRETDPAVRARVEEICELEYRE